MNITLFLIGLFVVATIFSWVKIVELYKIIDQLERENDNLWTALPDAEEIDWEDSKRVFKDTKNKIDVLQETDKAVRRTGTGWECKVCKERFDGKRGTHIHYVKMHS